MPSTTPTTARASLYKAPVDQIVTSTLMDFESATDSAFVDSAKVEILADPAHAGQRSLVADGGVRLNLASLVRGRDFGGAWDVVGVRIWSDSTVQCDVTLSRGGDARPVTSHWKVFARTWTPVWIDVARPSAATTLAATTSVDSLRLTIAPNFPRVHLLVDDIQMARSRDVVSESNVPRTNDHWSVTRAGLNWLTTLNGTLELNLPAAPFVEHGFRLVEAVPTRAVFQNDRGTKFAVDRMGRVIRDGVSSLTSRGVRSGTASTEEKSPAVIEIVGGEGRVDRSLPGDHDNDGYDEERGCYAVHAVGGRATFKMMRQNASVKWPVLEILDLPDGVASVWVEGEIIPWALRCDDGRLIAELPIELQTPVEVQVRVK